MNPDIESVTLRVIDIVPGTSVDGPGLRTSVYLAGCAHHCPGCHNPQSWDFAGGREMTVEEVCRIVEANGFDVTLSGGDPLYQLPAVTILAAELRRRGYGLWCFTGFLYEDIATKPEYTPLLSKLDVLVDGPFIENLRDLSLLFRGSSNQRLIDLHRSTPANPVLWSAEF